MDGATNDRIDRVRVGLGPTGIAVNPETNTIYVANSGSDTVSVIGGTNNTKIRDLSVGDFPFGVAVNPDSSTVYVTNSADGSLSIMNLNK
jgi:YVTN family beta-propeller protein